MAKLKEGFNRLKRLFQTSEDPLNLEEYQAVVGRISGSRGKNTRNLVMSAFLAFLNGVTTRLNWMLTAKSFQIPLTELSQWYPTVNTQKPPSGWRFFFS